MLFRSTSTLQNDKDKQLIYSSITSLNYYKGFSVLRTTSVNDTADLIIGMARKIDKNNAKGVKPFTNCEEITPYANVVKRCKKENITTENISQIMLCQIPGVSTVTSSAIFSKFGTIKNLITSITENPDCMNELSYIQSGKSRKVNSTAIKKIKDFLME